MTYLLFIHPLLRTQQHMKQTHYTKIQNTQIKSVKNYYEYPQETPSVTKQLSPKFSAEQNEAKY